MIDNEVSTSPHAPPPFHDSEGDPVPSYQRINRNPETLARYLFRLGFIFPFFWMLAATIIVTDLVPTSYTPIAGKSPEEQQEEIEVHRATELKWAWRSVYALGGWIILAIIILGIMRATHTGFFAS
ncbi:uncharacterized protein EI90DRAFT_3020538 [Cantharellus anzutake]|uniref:uncharacterized protein n=1 Tax=Cantharellus anzutake TaxID=1750568 RepID=UPI0019037C44|nr:uncharacterized protein EI90DRAFT_3020538 [Cantharellus anzutake]KAF8320632.1 hypothetical protein EI90DRAFT_3020538 [Cantharellus anzutake]